MSDEITLAQLAAQMAHVRQQMEQMNQRLDMIYGAVTRLAEAQSSPASKSPSEGAPTQAKEAPSSTTATPLTAAMMMDPGAMLDSLRQYAVNAGLDISPETVDLLKSQQQAGQSGTESKDDQK